jgi:superfamily I DNA/RNA helicase
MGVSGVSEFAYTNYLQLSRKDAFDFSNLTEEDFEKNNQRIASMMSELKILKDRALANKKNKFAWIEYYEMKDKVSAFFSTHDLGDEYIYNPSTDKMEKYSFERHKNVDKDMRIEKGIDFGHAITIHKSQGTTVKNVFFDANSLPSGGTPKLMQAGKEIGTEKHSLLYVGVSRASEYLGIHYANMANFYQPAQKQTEKNMVPSEGEMTLKNGKTYPFSKINARMLEVIGYSPEEAGKILKSIC